MLGTAFPTNYSRGVKNALGLPVPTVQYSWICIILVALPSEERIPSLMCGSITDQMIEKDFQIKYAVEPEFTLTNAPPWLIF